MSPPAATPAGRRAASDERPDRAGPSRSGPQVEAGGPSGNVVEEAAARRVDACPGRRSPGRRRRRRIEQPAAGRHVAGQRPRRARTCVPQRVAGPRPTGTGRPWRRWRSDAADRGMRLAHVGIRISLVKLLRSEASMADGEHRAAERLGQGRVDDALVASSRAIRRPRSSRKSMSASGVQIAGARHPHARRARRRRETPGDTGDSVATWTGQRWGPVLLRLQTTIS